MLSAASRRRIYVAVSQRSGLALKALPTNGSTRDLLTLSKSEIIQTYRRLVEDAKSPFKDGVQSLQSIVSSRLPLKSSSTLSFLGTDLSSMKPIYPAKGALHPEIPFSNSVSQFQKVTAEHWELIYSKNTGYSLLMWGVRLCYKIYLTCFPIFLIILIIPSFIHFLILLLFFSSPLLPTPHILYSLPISLSSWIFRPPSAWHCNFYRDMSLCCTEYGLHSWFMGSDGPTEYRSSCLHGELDQNYQNVS